MTNRIVTGILTVILGVLIACVPNFILTVCPDCQSMMTSCVLAAKTEYGVGVLIAFLGILASFAESREIRMGFCTAIGLVGIFAALVAKVLIGFCDGSCSPDCTCSPFTGTLVAALGILAAAFSFINVFYLSRTKNT